MSPKEIVFGPNAEKDFKKLQKRDQKAIFRHLDRLESGEGRLDVEKIKTHPDFYRLKVGDFRIVYYPLSRERVVLLLIRNRKDAYKGLNALDSRLETALRVIESNAVNQIAMGAGP